MTVYPRFNDDGSATVAPRVRVGAEHCTWRVTTPGGPGGQHANRNRTKVVVSIELGSLPGLTPLQREELARACGPVLRASASRFRSQARNREAAFTSLATRLAAALEPTTERGVTRPTRSAQRRRVEEKKARGDLKRQRRRVDED